MIIVIGGAYQGKLEYVKREYAVVEDDIYFCRNEVQLDLSKKVIYGFHNYILSLVECGQNIDIESLHISLKDKIIVCDDISQGIVPTDPLQRKWREEVGRAMSFLTAKSDSVIRLFCGIAAVIK